MKSQIEKISHSAETLVDSSCVSSCVEHFSFSFNDSSERICGNFYVNLHDLVRV